MTATSQVERLRALTGPAVESAGLVLEELTVTPVGRRRLLRVTVDLPEDVRGGVPVDAVAAASQAISTVLDDSDVMGQTPYVLEVSSPGVDRPLVEPRHWKRARGRLVQVRLTDGEHLQGRLNQVGADGVVVGDTSLAWSRLRSGRVEVEFGRSPDADPDDDPADDDPDDDVLTDDETEGSDAEGSA